MYGVQHAVLIAFSIRCCRQSSAEKLCRTGQNTTAVPYRPPTHACESLKRLLRPEAYRCQPLADFQADGPNAFRASAIQPQTWGLPLPRSEYRQGLLPSYAVATVSWQQ